jgi:microcompartment protein CcmK/EutM
MVLGKVIGNVWATRKDQKLTGLKLLIVRSVDLDYTEKETFVVAADSVGAGVGEIVLYCTGSSARQTEATENRPVDAVIMAIVDKLEKDT